MMCDYGYTESKNGCEQRAFFSCNYGSYCKNHWNMIKGWYK